MAFIMLVYYIIPAFVLLNIFHNKVKKIKFVFYNLKCNHIGKASSTVPDTQ